MTSPLQRVHRVELARMIELGARYESAGEPGRERERSLGKHRARAPPFGGYQSLRTEVEARTATLEVLRPLT
jgi:hypothetical protein